MAALLTLLGAGTTLALTSQSPNYELEQPEFGAGAALETCSGQYCARATIGELTPGESRSSGTAAFSSLTTDSEPALEVIVEPGESNLGVLSVDKTATKTSIIKIRTHMSDGYTLQIVGDPPKYDSYTLATPSTPTASMPGTEQFGINLVANTTPEVGADPEQVPSGEFSFGYAMEDYAEPNKFMYRSGDVVAMSEAESGITEFTVSMIVNVSNQTPAGHFTGDYAAIIVPAF